ncbi:MAG: HlyD family efflux transporter periplasmic adaptor subunit [Balneolaceae bacterium]
MELRKWIGILGVFLILTSCNKDDVSDAYGQFEADETTISSEAAGVLKQFDLKEGMTVEAGQQVGLVDTVQLSLKKKEIMASVRAIRTNISKLNAQADVYREQLETAKQDLRRFTSLKENNAATQQQIDQAQGQVNVLNKQITSVEVQKESVYAELETAQARIAQVADQIQRARIINPINGTVLSVFVEPHELVTSGKPLYRIANLGELNLKVYVSGAQLPQVAIGQKVEVKIDKDIKTNESLPGTVSWIASDAEFTPRMIQTKEERVTQVYAVKVRVPNSDGKLKIGMPGEVNF